MLEIKSTNSAANVEIELDFIWIPRDAIEIIFPSTGTERIVFYLALLRGFFIIAS